MRVNEDPDYAAARRRAARAEEKLAKALEALKRGPGITIRQRAELIEELERP